MSSGTQKKLIRLVKMCMKNTMYQVWTQTTLSETFEVMTGLKQDDTLSPFLFNIALDKVVTRIQESSAEGIDVDPVNI